MKYRSIALAIVVGFLLASFSCGENGQRTTQNSGAPNPPFQGEPPEEPMLFAGTPGSYGGNLVMALEGGPSSFNPLLVSGTSSTDITQNFLFAPITNYDPAEWKETPYLTKNFDVSPDGLEYTYYLRKGLRWSDGHPFTADDIVFNFQVIFDPKIENPNKDALTQSDKSFPVVEKVDDLTVKFKLKEVNALFNASVGSVYLAPKHKLEEAYKAGTFDQAYDLDTNPEDIVGMGPYRLIRYESDQRVVLERNPYFWKVDSKGQRLPYIDRVTLLIVPNQNAVFLQFQNGATDLHRYVRPEDVDLLKNGEAAGDYKVYELGTSLTTDYFAFNLNPGKTPDGKNYVDPIKSAWFNNKVFRQAISTAIDRQGLIDTAFQGRGTPIYSFTSPANKTWYNDAVVVKRPFDLDKAREMLKSIGMEDRNGDGIIEDDKGHPIEFTIMTNSNNPTRVNIVTFLQSDLQKLGIKINANPIDFNTVILKLTDTRDWEAVVLGWQSAVPPDPGLMKNIVLSSGRNHNWNPSQKTPATEWEKKLDELANKNTSTLDMAERKKYYDEMMAIWTDELPEIDLNARTWQVAAKNRVANLRPTILPVYIFWNVDELYLTK
jgi:peptide/nickel transport system substrate-binding protein